MLVRKLSEYTEWYESQPRKSQAQIEARLLRITTEAHWVGVKDLGEGLLEIKFNNGNRIYFVRTGIVELILLLGGNKNGQTKDISQARKIIRQNIKKED